FASFGIVGAATIAIFFGVGFLSLSGPKPTAPPADPVRSPQTLEARRDALPQDSFTSRGPLPGFPSDSAAASSAPGGTGDQDAPVLRSTATETTLMPQARGARAKRVTVSGHRHAAIKRYWAAVWQPNASAGPNPGGGFYGAPNINVGRVNP